MEFGVAREIRERIAEKATNSMAIKRFLFLSEVAKRIVTVSRGIFEP